VEKTIITVQALRQKIRLCRRNSIKGKTIENSRR